MDFMSEQTLSNVTAILTDDESKRDVLGKGASGLVYREDWHLDGLKLSVAVKEFGIERKETWHMEAKFLTSCNHPNVAKCYGTTSGKIKNKFHGYLFLELGDRSLREFLDNKENDIAWSIRISISRGISEGLLYLHSQIPPIFHRDLKASNVALRSNLTPFLIDFGISKYFKKKPEVMKYVPLTFRSASTKECGTYGYMAPEMKSKKKGPTSLASDIYSLGIIFYEIITRNRPYYYSVNRFQEKSKSELEKELAAVTACPQRFLQLTHSCLQEKASDRPNLESIIHTLKKILKEFPGTSLSLSPPKVRLELESRATCTGKPPPMRKLPLSVQHKYQQNIFNCTCFDNEDADSEKEAAAAAA